MTPQENLADCMYFELQRCQIDSVIVINALLKRFLNPDLDILVERSEDKNFFKVTDVSKQAMKTCITKIGEEELRNCDIGLWSTLKQILKSGDVSGHPKLENGDCVEEHFKVCSLKAMLKIMSHVYTEIGTLPNILLFPEKIEPMDIIKLITEEEKNILHECFHTLKEERVESCQPGLFPLLTELNDGYLVMVDLPPLKEKDCLGKIFEDCALRSRMLISDLIKFGTGKFLDFTTVLESVGPKPLSDSEKLSLQPCLNQLGSDVDICLPGLRYLINEIYQGNVPDISKIPLKITPEKCLAGNFKNCSAVARILLTDVIYRFTNIFVNLMFAVTKDRKIDPEMQNLVNECVGTIQKNAVENCISGLNEAFQMLSQGGLPLEDLKFRVKGERVSCVNEIFKDCNRTHLMLIDVLLRKIPHNYHRTAAFDVFPPPNADIMMHEHTELDHQTVEECFATLNQNNMESCVPGLFDAVKMAAFNDLPISSLTLRNIESSCLESNFAQCSYRSRFLIKDLLYDFARIFIDMPFTNAPEGTTGEMGPPINAIQLCISTVDSTRDDCVPDLTNKLYTTFIERKDKHDPILPSGKEEENLACLNDKFKYCDTPTKMFLLKKIAKISNIHLNIEIETYSVKNPIDAQKRTSAESSPESNPLAKGLIHNLPGVLGYEVEYNRINHSSQNAAADYNQYSVPKLQYSYRDKEKNVPLYRAAVKPIVFELSDHHPFSIVDKKILRLRPKRHITSRAEKNSSSERNITNTSNSSPYDFRENGFVSRRLLFYDEDLHQAGGAGEPTRRSAAFIGSPYSS